MPTLAAVCIVAGLRPDPGTVGVTAIDKRAVDGAVKIGPYGVTPDVQADRYVPHTLKRNAPGAPRQ